MNTDVNVLKPLALGISPLGETAVIRSSEIGRRRPSLENFLRHHSFNIHETKLANVQVISTLPVRTDAKGGQYIYGGRAFHQDAKRLILGGSDVDRFQLPASSLRAQCGEFHLVEIEPDRMVFSADYFGLQALFKYDDGAVQIVCTSYHLLLLLLRVLDCPLEVDVDKSLSMLSDRNVFGSGLAIDVRQCSVNYIYESFEFTSSGLNVLVDSALYDQLYDDRVEFNPDEYSKLIAAARDEIVDNIAMVFDHDQFDNVIVDLSGGLDSRVIYAACTVLPQVNIRKKIRINTQFGPSPNAKKGGDLEYAALINSLYNYDLWSDYGEGADLQDISGERSSDYFYVNKISRLFGTHKNFNHVVPKYADYYPTNIVRLSGFIGEVFRGANFEATHGDKMTHINNYTNFRNRYMASRPFENILSPLASKSLLKASRMYQWNREGSLSITPELDVLTAINPLLSLMPFFNSDLKQYFKDVDPEEMLNFPGQVEVSSAFVDKPSSTVVKTKQKPNADSQFVLDPGIATTMVKSLRKSVPELSDFIDEFLKHGRDIVENRNARVLSMLWSLYFEVEIIRGNGDFGPDGAAS